MKPETLLARKAHAYFAPVGAGALDLTVFAADPPDGWTDLGWIENLRRTSGTRVEAVHAGSAGTAAAQYRSSLDARVEFDFMEWGRLQMALSACGQQMNLLGTGGAVAVSTQSTRAQLFLEADASPFVAGDLVAVDADYSGQTGPVGAGIAGAYVRNAADVGKDVDYIRRVTVNAGRVSAVDGASLILQQPLPCAIPAGARAQKVIAFADSEGGSFFPEWSGLFVLEGEAGGRIAFYYPRLQAAAPAQENVVTVDAPLEAIALHASLRALPGANQALCYRMYFPA